MENVKCSAHSDVALTWRRNDSDDGLTAMCWKTNEFKLKEKQN